MYHRNSQVDSIYKKGTLPGAVLLLHGFTGSPDSVRSLANYLHSMGYTVSAPLLNGHGTTKENLEKTTWKDWYDTAQKSFLELKEKHTRLCVGGLSLGALLTLRLAQEYPQSVDAIACLATPLFMKPWVRAVLPLIAGTPLKAFYRYQKKFAVDVKDPQAKINYWNLPEMPVSCVYSIMELQSLIKQQLPKITAPLLMIHSRYDSTAPYESMTQISRGVSSTVAETVTLENSFHLITMDYEKELVAQKTGQFFARYLLDTPTRVA